MLKQKQPHHHEEGIAKAHDQTFLRMIENIIMQAKSHIKLNSPVSPSYKLNRSKNLFVRALAIFVGAYGRSCYTYRMNVAYCCLRKLVNGFNNNDDIMQLDEIALRRLLLTTEVIPKPDAIDH